MTIMDYLRRTQSDVLCHQAANVIEALTRACYVCLAPVAWASVNDTPERMKSHTRSLEILHEAISLAERGKHD